MSVARTARRPRRGMTLLTAWSVLTLLGGLVISAAASPPPASASHTPAPSSVTIAGDLQSEIGCAGDWDPACAAAHLAYDGDDTVWQGSFALPAGSYQYKAALNDSWTENYGLHAISGGDNIPLNLGANRAVKFYYDHGTHWITDNVSSVIATVPGDFQSELGCPGDWDPGCLRSWLQDPDGDGIYRFETTALPAGNYEAKATINESWDENYGQGGVQNGANIPFSVPVTGAIVKFRYDSATHVLSILAGHSQNNDVEWAGLYHDSRDLLYRTPGGAVPAGTPVRLRFRTFHNDVTTVKLRTYDLNAGAQSLTSMTRAASDVSCYDANLASETCDFWAVTLANGAPDNLWYRFVVSDGSDTDYYADNTPALDGGVGAPSDDPIDTSYALMVYTPGFTSPAWAKSAVIYQIFPDRFRNGRKDNDPATGDQRYDDPVLKLPWGTLPEGYCRNYADGAANCPWRYDATPPDYSPTKESPRGRDYMGGDLKGVDQELDYLASLGVTAIYFNPLFDSASNHGYDSQDYTKIDPYFGTQKDWDNLQKHAKAKGMRIILDGVFNHLSSDSMFFDRYHQYATLGACESASSPFRAWFTFHDVAAGTGTCASSSDVTNGATYDGWFGFDSIPVLSKTNAQVQAYFLTNPDSIAARWLAAGAGGWRLDVAGDASFPAGYWETFRSVVKGKNPNALTISETWQKDSTLLRMLRGDRLDSTMNYRLRDAVIGLLAPGSFDSKGFADSGSPIDPSEFAARLASIREDYPDAAYYALMNLLDSHDTERLRWTLTPGAETTASKELDAAHVSEGKRRQELAALIQYGVPGAPTVYYGDEIGVTGDDDPDDRRTYPWTDLGGSPDTGLFAYYQSLAAVRAANPALTSGDFRNLLADDGAGTIAFGRRTGSRAAIIAVNRSDTAHTVSIPVSGFVPDGTTFSAGVGVGVTPGGSFAATGGEVSIWLPALGGAILQTGSVDLAAPGAPANLHVTGEGNGEVSLAWNAVAGAAGYNVYRSPLTGGGFVKVNGAPLTGTSLTDTGLQNGRTQYFVVTALDGPGNESGWSAETSGLPHLTIGWANLQWPPTMSHTISVVDRTDNAYGQVWIDGETSKPGATPSLRAQLGFGPNGSGPAGNADWEWLEASFNVDAGNNDEFVASMLPDHVGTFSYVYRYSTTNGRDWLYADLNGPFTGTPPNPGVLTVNASADTTAPSTPTGLHVASSSPATIDLDWDDNAGDASLYGYEVGRSATNGGPYTVIALVTSSAFTDTTVDEGATYHYAVRAVDLSFNRSGWSGDVTGAAEARTVTLVFNVTVPSTTDATGRSAHIAGFLDRLDGGYPQWDPGATALTRVDATHWTITFTGKEGVQLEYKYTLGDWDHVEKDGACGEISNRLLTLAYGATGTQTVNDTVANWRNVAPCGN
jgi:glycosidase